MGQVEFADQPIQRPRLFQRVQVFALDVLDERHRDRRLVRYLPDDGRDLLQTRHLGRTPAALAGNDFILDAAAPLDGPRNDRLHDALGPDRAGQVLERILANIHARLVLAALQQVDRQLAQAVARTLCVSVARHGSRLGNGLAEQGVQAAAESFLWCHLVVLPRFSCRALGAPLHGPQPGLARIFPAQDLARKRQVGDRAAR